MEFVVRTQADETSPCRTEDEKKQIEKWSDGMKVNEVLDKGNARIPE